MVLIVKINTEGRDEDWQKIRDYVFAREFLRKSWPGSLRVEEVDTEALLSALIRGKDCIQYMYDVLK